MTTKASASALSAAGDGRNRPEAAALKFSLEHV